MPLPLPTKMHSQRYYKPRCGAGLVPREDCRWRVRRKCSGPPVHLCPPIWPIEVVHQLNLRSAVHNSPRTPQSSRIPTSLHLLKLYKLKIFKSRDKTQDMMLNIWAYNMMSLILNFLLILISESYW